MRRFLSLEWSLRFKGKFKAVDEVIQEYFELGHTELVPIADFNIKFSIFQFMQLKRKAVLLQRSVPYLMPQLNQLPMFPSMIFRWSDQLFILP